MFCPVCGSKIYKDAKYCKKCGLRLLPEDSPPPSLTAVHIPEEDEEAVKKELLIANKRIKPATSLVNILSIFYFVLVLLIFYKLHPRTGNVLVTFVQCIGYSSPVLLLAVLYNSLKGRAEFVRSLSFVVTVFFIMISVLGEMGRFGAAGGRLADFGSLEDIWMNVNCGYVNCNSNPNVNEPVIDLVTSGEFHLVIPSPMKKVYLVDPAIASINILSPTEARVTGKSKGSTLLTVWDISGKETRFKVNVK
jgi:Pilus formation protein N terminal region/zinc-ribbon domain